MAQHGEVLGGVTLANAAGIFVEGNVQTPMHFVFDSPMAAHRVLDRASVTGQTADVVAGLNGDPIANPTFKLDLGDRTQGFPLAALAQIAQVARVGDGPTVADLQS